MNFLISFVKMLYKGVCNVRYLQKFGIPGPTPTVRQVLIKGKRRFPIYFNPTEGR